MGDPRKIRKKYETPVHPWQKERILEEQVLMKEYSLKNKKEIWKFSSFLKKYKDQAKKLIAMRGKQADLERKQMMDKLKSYGLITASSETFDAIFSLQLRDVLDRMLQTRLFKKGLARSINQARQFVVHGHVLIGDQKITAPRYLVRVNEDHLINFVVSSPLYSTEHPERPKPETNKSPEEVSNVDKDKNVSKKKTTSSSNIKSEKPSEISKKIEKKDSVGSTKSKADKKEKKESVKEDTNTKEEVKEKSETAKKVVDTKGNTNTKEEVSKEITEDVNSTNSEAKVNK